MSHRHDHHRAMTALLACAALTLVSAGCASSDVGKAPVPHSLQGTDADGALRVAADGNFVADEDAIQLFDYVLTTEGEVGDTDLHLMVRAEAREQLPANRVSDAETAFAAYMTYRLQSAEILASGDDPAAIESELVALHAEAVKTLPGIAADLPRLQRAMALRAVSADASYKNAETRRSAVTRIEAEMTPAGDALANAEAREASRRALTLRAETRALQSDGASAEDIRAIRAARVGVEAAERLAELDARRAEWQRRVREYRASRTELLDNLAPESDAETALEQLRQSRFDSREALRIHALERTGQLDAI